MTTHIDLKSAIITMKYCSTLFYIILFHGFVVFGQSSLNSCCSDCYCRLIDFQYHECIKKYSDIASSPLVLKSANSKCSNNLLISSSNEYTMEFHIPYDWAGEEIEILLHDANKLYYICPTKKIYSSGIQYFNWDQSFWMDSLGLKLKDLNGLIRLKNPKGIEGVLNSTLYYTDIPCKYLQYEFVLIANARVSLAAYIINSNSDTLMYKVIKNYPRNKDIIINWEPENPKRDAYFLKIEYVLNNRNGSLFYKIFM